MRIHETLPWDEGPNERLFHAWVEQSINKTALNRLKAVSAELALADKLSSCYITESGFEAQLFALSADQHLPKSGRVTAVNFLRANAPFLKIESPEQVARICRDSPRVFEKFQASLLHVSSELAGVEAGDFDDKAKGVFAREIEPQIRDIKAQLSKITTQGAGGVLIGMTTVGLALLAAPSLPFSAVLLLGGLGTMAHGVGGALPSIGEYMQKRRGPAFIWSEIAVDT
jgi:hypothetical protein